jgi:hypothetical protein
MNAMPYPMCQSSAYFSCGGFSGSAPMCVVSNHLIVKSLQYNDGPGV